MPRHILMWWLSGGATLVGASMAYAVARPQMAPTAARAREVVRRMTSTLPKIATSTLAMFNAPRDTQRSHAGFYEPLHTQPSGNAAFEAYRAEEIKKLQEQERDFQAYLSGLRLARDREEFNSFLARGRERSGTAIARPMSD